MAIRYTFSNGYSANEIEDHNYSDVVSIVCDTDKEFEALLNSDQEFITSAQRKKQFKILSSVTIKKLSEDAGEPLTSAKIKQLIDNIHGEQPNLKTIVIQGVTCSSDANSDEASDDETVQSESDDDSSDSEESELGFDRSRSNSEVSIFSDDSLDGELEHVFPKSRDYLSVNNADGLMKNLGLTQNNTLTHLHIDGADLSTLRSEELKGITLPALKTLSANKLTISLGELLVLLAQAPAIETIDLTNCTISLDYDTSAKDMKFLYDVYEARMTEKTVKMFDELLLRTVESFDLDESDEALEELVEEPYALSECSISPVTTPELSSSDSISTTTTGTSHTSETDYAVIRSPQEIKEADLESSIFSEVISDMPSLKKSIESSFKEVGCAYTIQETKDNTSVIVTDGSKKLMEAGSDKVKVYSGFLNPKQTPLDMKKKAQLILHSLGIPSEGEDIPNRLYFKGEDKNPKLVQAINTQLSELRHKRYVDSRPRWHPQ